MKVYLAKTAGFCFGVDRAVSMVEQAAKDGLRAVTLGPIIHNRHVVQRFAEMGVRQVDEVSEIEDGCAVIIRSHGVSRAVYEELEARNLTILDATCPFVKRIHEIVRKATEQGRQVIIIGTRTHPEIVAIAGWCDSPVVFENAGELQAWLDEDPRRADLAVTMVSQTTSTEALWKSCCEIIKKVYTNAEIFDTICGATEKRQKEAIALAGLCDGMVIVGDAMSSNTKRLAMICREHCKLVSQIGRAHV